MARMAVVAGSRAVEESAGRGSECARPGRSRRKRIFLSLQAPRKKTCPRARLPPPTAPIHTRLGPRPSDHLADAPHGAGPEDHAETILCWAGRQQTGLRRALRTGRCRPEPSPTRPPWAIGGGLSISQSGAGGGAAFGRRPLGPLGIGDMVRAAGGAAAEGSEERDPGGGGDGVRSAGSSVCWTYIYATAAPRPRQGSVSCVPGWLVQARRPGLARVTQTTAGRGVESAARLCASPGANHLRAQSSESASQPCVQPAARPAV